MKNVEEVKILRQMLLEGKEHTKEQIEWLLNSIERKLVNNIISELRQQDIDKLAEAIAFRCHIENKENVVQEICISKPIFDKRHNVPINYEETWYRVKIDKMFCKKLCNVERW